MANETSIPAFVIPDRNKLAVRTAWTLRGLIVAGVAFLAYIFLLPFLLTVVWGSVELLIGIAVLGLLLWLVTNKKIRKAVNYFFQAFAEGLLSRAIEMNRWNILNDQANERLQALENVKTQTIVIKGEQARTSKEIGENDILMKESWEEMNILKEHIKNARTPDEVDDFTMKLETAQTHYTNAKGFIDNVQPTLNGLNTLATSMDKIYRKGTNTLLNFKSSIASLKRQFDITESGSKAMQSAQIALNGNPATQQDADKAYESIAKQMSLQLGMITQGIQATTQIMDASDLRDAAKIRLAAKTAEQFASDDNFKYSGTISDTGVKGLPNTVSGNKFIDLLNK